MSRTYSIAYPRRRVVRSLMRVTVRVFLKALTRNVVTGKENLPADGPLIVVGNHVAMIEVLLMVIHVPWLIEMMGVGDVPLDPMFAPVIVPYGYIPINRGSMDRKGMNKALDVLDQGGVVGIFPEGGIWEEGLRQGRTGVAWLSSKANAPILPMGFGGMVGALGAMVKLKRPELITNIGEVIPPIAVDVPGKSRKQALDDGAQRVMERINALIPPEEKARHRAIVDERFELNLTITHPDGLLVEIPPPDDLLIGEAEGLALAKLFQRPVILNTMRRNLKLPVQALQQLDSRPASTAIAAAADAALRYLKQGNPHFLSYRFGPAESALMQDGLCQLRDLARWAAKNGYTVRLRPIRRYRYADSDEEIVEGTIGKVSF